MTKEEATKRGQALLRRMRGKGWKLQVWENLGWHYSVTLHRRGWYLDVRADYGGHKSYHAMLGSSPGSCDTAWFDRKYFADPNRAVRHRLKLMRRHAEAVMVGVEGIEAAFKDATPALSRLRKRLQLKS